MDTPAPNIIFLFLLSLLIVCSTATEQICAGAGVFMKLQEPSMEEDHTFHSSRRHLITPPQLTVTVSPNPPLITVPSSTPVTVAPTLPPPTAATPVTNNPPANNPVVTPPPAAGQTWCVAKVGAAAASVQAALDYACGAGAECAPIQQGATCFSPNTLQNHASYAFSSFYQRHSGQATSCDFKGAAEMTNVNPSSGLCIYPSLSSSASPTTAPPTNLTPMTPNPATPTPMTPYPATPMTPNPATPTPMTPYPATPTPFTPNPATPTTPTLMTPTPMTPYPATPTPFTPNPMTPSSSSLAAPPTIFNGIIPPLGSGSTGFGENPPAPSTSSTSSMTMSASLQQSFISCIILVASIITVLDI